MRKLTASVLLLGALLLGNAMAQPAPEPWFQMVPNDRPVMLDRYLPAAGPLQRFTSRPGAWYATLFLAAPPQWPVQFVVMQRNASHELRVLALDTNPAGEVISVNFLPMSYTAARHGQPAQYVADFVLPAHAAMDGVTLVLEQWSRSGEPPPAIWINARFASGYPSAGNGTAWWSPQPARPSSGHAASALVGPPSPLLSQGERRGVYEIPLQQMPAPPVPDPFSAR